MVLAEAVLLLAEEAGADREISQMAVVEVVFSGQGPGLVEGMPLLLRLDQGQEQRWSGLGQGPDPMTPVGPWRPAGTIVGRWSMAELAGSPFLIQMFFFPLASY